ncbi:MAG: hypothetical protein E4G90_04180 [Gemmatimonadales bacterium]|nr:MAG: hypothetical protein E4G90_04180 [Gemmatimonadales bacterium]
MKMFSWLLVAMLVVASWVSAQTNEVTSVNVVGYYKTTLVPSGAYHQVAIQFEPFNPTFEGVFGTNQLRAHFLSARSDQVHLWNGKGYDRYGVYSNAAGNWYFSNVTNGWGTVAVNPPLHAGDACFIFTPRAGPYVSATNTVTIMGEVIDVPTQMVNVVTSGYAMVCYPFSSETRIDQLQLTQIGFATSLSARADQIWVFDSPAKAYKRYALRNTTPPEWRQTYPSALFSTGPAASNTLPLGQAFWYIRSTYASPLSLTWSETNKYINNLR